MNFNHQICYTAAAAAAAAVAAAAGCSSSGRGRIVSRLPPLPADVTRCGLCRTQPRNQK